MHRAFVGDLQQPLTLVRIEVAQQCNGALDPVDRSFLRLAGFAVGGVDPPVTQSNRDLIEGQRLRSAYSRSVIAVQAPSPASTRS